MKYNLKKPCANCPFRTDIHPFLTKGRAREIVQSLVTSEFPCHKTLDYDAAECDENGDYDPVETAKTQHCAGALIMLEKMERPSQMMRICERIGLYDARKLDMDAPVFDSADKFIKAQPRA